jgi:hypothetical protein
MQSPYRKRRPQAPEKVFFQAVMIRGQPALPALSAGNAQA